MDKNININEEAKEWCSLFKKRVNITSKELIVELFNFYSTNGHLNLNRDEAKDITLKVALEVKKMQKEKPESTSDNVIYLKNFKRRGI